MPKRKRKPPKESLPEPSPPLGALDDYIDTQRDWEKAFSPSLPHPTKPLLACGHYSHPDGLEERWNSSEFAEKTIRQKNRLTQLITAVRKEGLLKLDKHSLFPTPEDERIYEMKRYFSVLRNRFGMERRSQYLAQVDLYEEANLNFLDLPPCRREGKITPLHPSEIEGMIQPDNLQTPRSGGRLVSLSEQEKKRDKLILDMKEQDSDARSICKRLHQGRAPIPDSCSWKQKGWVVAYSDPKTRGLVHSFLSKRGTKPKTRP